MAIVKLSSEIESVHGRYGGVYFKKDPSGQHIQAMPKIVDYPRVGVQGLNRDGYSTMAALWHLVLIAGFHLAWSLFGAAHLFTTKSGEKKRLSGYSWYVHYWLLFPEEERLPYWKPPHAPGALPALITTWQGRQTYRLPEEQWPPECSAGYYWEGLPWNGKPSYKEDNFRFFIWWTGTKWCVSPGLGFEDEQHTYYSKGAEKIGWYKNPVTNQHCHVYAGRRPGL